MKGIILAGGLGRRLGQLTRITNKHLLHIYNKPMIYYPLQILANAGIKDIMIVTGGNNAEDFLRLLDKGQEFGLKGINYAYQQGEKGIADALSLAEHFAAGEKIVVVLGDNIIEKPIKKYLESFSRQSEGARILIKKVPDPQRFGVVERKGKKIISIEEKPKKPKSNYIVTGIYMYDAQVFDIIRTLKPSWRNELEITDVNNIYLGRNQLYYDVLEGFWSDCGLPETIYKATTFIRNKCLRQERRK